MAPASGSRVALAAVGGRARVGGVVAAAAAFAELAAALTPDADRRADRALAAAAMMLPVGEPGTVTRLLAEASAAGPGVTGVAGDSRRIRADLVRPRLAIVQNQGGYVPRRLVELARRLDRSEATQVRAAHLDAIRG